MLRTLLFYRILQLALVSMLAMLTHAQQHSCNEGDRRCQAQSKTSPFYYRCAGGQWTLYTCGNGYTCSSDGGSSAECVSNNPTPPSCIDGQRRCVETGNPGLYYMCVGGAWKTYTCGNGYQCKQTASLQATCNPAAPQCRNNAQRCAGAQSPALYYACAEGRWQQKSCKPQDRCINIPGDLINCQVGIK